LTSNAIPEAVYLDAQAFENASFNFASKQFTALKKHLESGRLRLIITDITVAEVKSRTAKNIAKEVAAHEKFAKAARVLRSSETGRNVLSTLDKDAIVKELLGGFDQFLHEHKADMIDTTANDPGPVFERYFAGKPPFGEAAEKKYEFPDAFVIEALKEWTEDNEEELFVVSGDDLFREACQECDEIHVKATLVEMLDHVASDDEKVAKFIRERLEAQAQEIGKQAAEQFEGLGFHLIDEWGDVEVVIKKVTLSGDPEIIDIGTKEANAQMIFDIEYAADISWDDSSTGIYDSEEGRMMFMEERRTTVNKTHEAFVDVHLTFNGLDPAEFEVDEVDLVDPTGSIGIRTPSSHWEDD
jgi:hypothetical protein